MRPRSSTASRDRSKGENLLAWVRFVLAKAKRSTGESIVVDNLAEDFSDGVVLAKLLSILSKREVGKLKEGPRLQRFECLGNLSVSFDFMKRLGVKLANIGPEDVVSGNSKLIQGLIWTLINFFLVEVEPEDAGEPTFAPGLTPKQRMLEWVKMIANSYPGVNVQSWRTGFQDGLALCALVHFHCPRELDYYALDRDDAKANVLKVFDVLEKKWGIPRLVDPMELLNGKADEEMILTLVATCKRELKNPPEGESAAHSGVGAVVPEDGYNLETRKLLRVVVESASKGDRATLDDALADVLRVFRDLLQEIDDTTGSVSSKRQTAIHAARVRLDRALRDLLQDAVQLCQTSQSSIYMRLVRRDVSSLCASENELMGLLGDDAEVSKKVMIDRMRTLRLNKEPAKILQVSKLLEEENARLAEAAKSKIQAREMQLEPINSKVAHLMIAELEGMAPLFAPLAAKLAEDPANKDTQRELAELNREITGIMADLDVTLNVDASKELYALQSDVRSALDVVRACSAEMDEAQRCVLRVASRCQTALTSARLTCEHALPAQTSRPINECVDVLDDALSKLQLLLDTVKIPQEFERALEVVLEAAEDLTLRVLNGEEEYRKESAVPEVRDAVSVILVAIRQGDGPGIMKGSTAVEKGITRAITLAKSRAPQPENAVFVNNFVKDLEMLKPRHAEAAKRASEAPRERMVVRNVAEMSRDVLSVVKDLDDVSRVPVVEDEFSSLQELLGQTDPLSMFDAVTESRDVADAVRQAVSEDPAAIDASAILQTIEELEQALPSIVKGEHKAKKKVVDSLPSLEKAVKKRDKKRAKERQEAPEDDFLRLGRYARAGVEEKELQQMQSEASSKSKKWVQKQKKKAEKLSDPIRQQRIMEAVSELEAMAPLQKEAFEMVLLEPELVVARDEFEQLTEGLASTTGGLDGLFPDLLLSTPIDLDSAIRSLESESRDADEPAPKLRHIDLETLAPSGPRTVTAPEMLQLDVLDTPQMSRRKRGFDAEPHAQRVVEVLADAGDVDEDVLSGDEFAAVLEDLTGKLAKLRAHVEDVSNAVRLPERAISVVDDACDVIQCGKRVAHSMDDSDDESPLLYTGLEDLANRVAELVFAVQEHLQQEGGDLENLKATCAALTKQATQMEQLANSRALLLSVDKLSIPSAESALADVTARIDRSWSEEPSRDYTKDGIVHPGTSLIASIKSTAKSAVREWAWDRFVGAVVEALERVHVVVPLIQDSGRRVLVRQAGEVLLGRAKRILWVTVHNPEEISVSISAMVESAEALEAACKLLDAKVFRPVRTIENCPGAAVIHNALMEGVSVSPKSGELFHRIKQIQEKMPPLTVELRSFKASPTTFVPDQYIHLMSEMLTDSGLVSRGLEDEATKTLLQNLREQVADTGVAFLFCALDASEYAGADSVDEGLLALKRLSVALLQLGKWARKAVSALQPTRSIAADPDTSRIMRQLRGLRQDKTNSPRVIGDLGTIRGLVIGVGDAINSTENALKVVPSSIDPSEVGDAVVHVILVVSSLSRHYGQDAHVQQLCGMTELLAHAIFEVIFRVRDLSLPVGNSDLVVESVNESLTLTGRMRERTKVLSAKLVKLGELRSVVDALDACEGLLEDPVPTPPRVSSLPEFERVVKRETAIVLGHCNRLDSFDYAGFGSSIVACAGAVRNNASIVSDGAAIASMIRLTSTMVSAGGKVLRVLELAAVADASSDAYYTAQIRLAEEVKTVTLLANKIEEVVGEHCAAPSSSQTSTSPSPGSPQSEHQPRQTLLVGKSLTVAISELSKGQTAVFSSADQMPNGLSGSLAVLSPTEEKIKSLVVSHGPSPELQRALLYFMNLVKHLSSGYLKGDTGNKLVELVKLSKEWAGRVIMAMRAKEQEGRCDVSEVSKSLDALHRFITTQVVLCCALCKKAISGAYTTADGVSFHNTCFKCATCNKAISGPYFREGDYIYCSEDVPMTNHLNCNRCGEPIELGTNYLECRSGTYHRECFSCIDCGKPLLSSHFYVKDGEIACDEHA